MAMIDWDRGLGSAECVYLVAIEAVFPLESFLLSQVKPLFAQSVPPTGGDQLQLLYATLRGRSGGGGTLSKFATNGACLA